MSNRRGDDRRSTKMQYVFLVHHRHPVEPPIGVMCDVAVTPAWMSTTVAISEDSVEVSADVAAAGDLVSVCVVEAGDLDQAIRIAGSWPRGARVEIRPVDGGWSP